MDKVRCGIQLYTLRNSIKDERGVRDTFKRLAALGVDLVQISAMCELPAKTIKEISEENGISVCCTHTKFDKFITSPEAVAEDHLLFNCETVGLGMMPAAYRANNFARLPEFIDICNQIFEKLAKYGLKFAYHNHNFELSNTYQGKTVYDTLIEKTNMDFIMDTFWVRFAGKSNEEYIKKLDGRITNIHLKDYKPKFLFLVPHMTELGKGELDFPHLLDLASASGTKYALYEQDICLNAWRSVENSWTYLKGAYINK